MTYLFTEIDRFDDEAFHRCLPQVGLARRAKALRYRRPIDRRLSVCAWMLLCRALRIERGWGEIPEPMLGRWGKPALPGVEFNLSHCERGVLCVLSTEAVGCDIQQLDAVVFSELRHAPEFLLPRERRAVERSASPLRAMCELWCAKESFGKRAGRGLALGLGVDFADLLGSRVAMVDGCLLQTAWRGDVCMAVCGPASLALRQPVYVSFSQLMKEGMMR